MEILDIDKYTKVCAWGSYKSDENRYGNWVISNHGNCEYEYGGIEVNTLKNSKTIREREKVVLQ